MTVGELLRKRRELRLRNKVRRIGVKTIHIDVVVSQAMHFYKLHLFDAIFHF